MRLSTENFVGEEHQNLNGSVFAGDFETTTEEDDCRVWHWGLSAVGSDWTCWGINIDSFLNTVLNQKDPITVYFHNLRFDGTFILDALLKRGYKHIVLGKNESLPQHTMSSLISDGSFYKITVRDEKNVVNFCDSLKKFNMSVDAVARAFSTRLSKGSIDYKKHRPVGYMPTREELDYLEGDICIMSEALAQQLEEGMNGLTVAGDSFRDWKKRSNLSRPLYYRRRFPVLELDREIRKAYRGGWTIAHEAHRDQHVGPGMVFDVNSLYPSVMYNRKLPYGSPTPLDSVPDDPFWIGCVSISGALKGTGVPCFPIKDGYKSYMYVSHFDHEEVWATGVDFKLWEDMYDLEVHDISCVMHFNAVQGMFRSYIDHWSEVKANSTGGRRALAKLHLNSLYGKFAARTEHRRFIPVLRNGVVGFEHQSDESEPQYSAMACFITAWARDVTVRAAAACGERFCYADTDSIHITGTTPPPGLDIHPTRLGAWKHECTFDDAVFGGAKRYAELVDGVWDKHVAGMPKDMIQYLHPDDLINGRTFEHGKLVPKRVPGGVVLVETPFTL